MSEWTAPESGWYEFRSGEPPRKLTDAEAEEARGADAGDTVQFTADAVSTRAWSAGNRNVMLPNGQAVPPACRVIVTEHG